MASERRSSSRSPWRFQVSQTRDTGASVACSLCAGSAVLRRTDVLDIPALPAECVAPAGYARLNCVRKEEPPRLDRLNWCNSVSLREASGAKFGRASGLEGTIIRSVRIGVGEDADNLTQGHPGSAQRSGCALAPALHGLLVRTALKRWRLTQHANVAGRQRRTKPENQCLDGVGVVRALAKHEHLRHTGTPITAPENHSSPSRRSDAWAASRSVAGSTAGIRDAPESASRSQITSSDGSSRLTNVGECVATRTWARSVAARSASTRTSKAYGWSPWSTSSIATNGGGDGLCSNVRSDSSRTVPND